MSLQERLREFFRHRAVLLSIFILLGCIAALVSIFSQRKTSSDQASYSSNVDSYQSPSADSAGLPVPMSDSQTSPFPESRTQSPSSRQTTQTPSQRTGVLSRIASIFRRSQPSPDTSSQAGLDTRTGDLYIPELRQAPELPTISIQKHILTTELPEKPSTARVYKLKTDFSEEDVSLRAQQLGFQNIDATEKGPTMLKLYDLTHNLYLGMDTHRGTFTFYARDGVEGKPSQGSVEKQARSILSQAGLDESFLVFGASYQYEDDSLGTVVAEFHRDWNQVGFPIINPLGMLNLTETQSLENVALGWQSPYAYTDAGIINTSDKQDGLTRPDGFNTISVRFSPTNGRIYEIASTLPTITGWEEISSDKLVSPIDAYSTYTSGATSLSFTGPAGEGSVTLPEVYSNGMAQAKEVDVTDFELIYPESGELALSEWWCPVYALRSFGRVQTGFKAQFAHTVPAVDDPRCSAPVSSAQKSPSHKLVALKPVAPFKPVKTATHVLGLVAQAPTSPIPTLLPDSSSSSLKYGTFAFKDEVIPDTYSNECPTDFNHSYIIEQTTDYIDYVAWIDRSVSRQNGTKRRPLASRTIEGPDRTWYFVRKLKAQAQPKLISLSPSFSEGQLRDFRMQAYNNSRQGEASTAPLDPQFNQLDTIYCQFILTGSPWVHVYSPSQQTFRITPLPVGGVAYAQPHMINASWVAKTTSSTTDHASFASVPLHWEYKAELMRNLLKEHYAQHPSLKKEGMTIETRLLKPTLISLAHQLGLTQNETQLLIAELERPSLRIADPYTTIRLTPQTFLDEHMRVAIEPAPQTRGRYIFALEGQSTYSLLSPLSLQPLIRKGITAVETGFILLQ